MEMKKPFIWWNFSQSSGRMSKENYKTLLYPTYKGKGPFGINISHTGWVLESLLKFLEVKILMKLSLGASPGM